MSISENRKQRSLIRVFIDHAVICLCTVFVMTCVFSLNYVPSESMEPTILRKHLVLTWRLPYLLGDPVPEYGSIVVFRENGAQNRLLIKRVVGHPGDVISIFEGKVYRNDDELEEPYLLSQESTYSTIPEYTVPDDALFVLGDNRYNSRDSRFMEETFVPVKNVFACEIWQFPF